MDSESSKHSRIWRRPRFAKSMRSSELLGAVSFGLGFWESMRKREDQETYLYIFFCSCFCIFFGLARKQQTWSTVSMFVCILGAAEVCTNPNCSFAWLGKKSFAWIQPAASTSTGWLSFHPRHGVEELRATKKLPVAEKVLGTGPIIDSSGSRLFPGFLRELRERLACFVGFLKTSPLPKSSSYTQSVCVLMFSGSTRHRCERWLHFQLFLKRFLSLQGFETPRHPQDAFVLRTVFCTTYECNM